MTKPYCSGYGSRAPKPVIKRFFLKIISPCHRLFFDRFAVAGVRNFSTVKAFLMFSSSKHESAHEKSNGKQRNTMERLVGSGSLPETQIFAFKYS